MRWEEDQLPAKIRRANKCCSGSSKVLAEGPALEAVPASERLALEPPLTKRASPRVFISEIDFFLSLLSRFIMMPNLPALLVINGIFSNIIGKICNTLKIMSNHDNAHPIPHRR